MAEQNVNQIPEEVFAPRKPLPSYMWGSRPRYFRLELLLIPLFLSLLFHFVSIVSIELMGWDFFSPEAASQEVKRVFKVQTGVAADDNFLDLGRDPVAEITGRDIAKVDVAVGRANKIVPPDFERSGYAPPSVNTGVMNVEPEQSVPSRLLLENDSVRRAEDILGSEYRLESGEGTGTFAPGAGGRGGVPPSLEERIFSGNPNADREGLGVSVPKKLKTETAMQNPSDEIDMAVASELPVGGVTLAPLEDEKDLILANGGKVRDEVPLERDIAVDFSVYEEPGDPKCYFKLSVKLKKESLLATLPKHVLFLVDTSQSITPVELEETKNAVVECIKSLNPGDKFDVARFAESIDDCFNGYVDPLTMNITKAGEFLKNRRAGARTDIYKVLSWAVKNMPKEKNLPVQIYLISDGLPTEGKVGTASAGDTKLIVRDFARQLPLNVSVFAFDAGPEGNRYLLSLLSYRSRGYSQSIPEEAGSGKVLIDFFRSHNRPVLTNVRSSYSNLDYTETYPQLPPNLYRDRGIYIYGRCLPGQEVRIRVVGQDTDKDRFFDFVRKIPAGDPNNNAIAKNWAIGKVHFLTAEITKLKDNSPDAADLIQMIKQLGSKYQIWTPYTPLTNKLTSPELSPGLE